MDASLLPQVMLGQTPDHVRERNGREDWTRAGNCCLRKLLRGAYTFVGYGAEI